LVPLQTVRMEDKSLSFRAQRAALVWGNGVCLIRTSRGRLHITIDGPFVIESAKFNVITAHNGNEALELRPLFRDCAGETNETFAI
jgi:hypothetical protein